MKQLLADHIFSSSLRYEGHKLVYTLQEGEPIVLGGILGAALLCVRLLNTDEQNERGFVLNEDLRYDSFYKQYESEVIADDWGYIESELEQLDLAYLELYANENTTIETICPNRRQLSIALDVVATYMRRITIERYGAHIYDLVPWTTPFAQWLFTAAHAEPRRQRFLTVDWTDPALVHDLACDMEKNEPEEPVFIFEGEQAADIMNRYWDWLWNFAQIDAATFPDAKVVMAEYKKSIRKEETDYEFIKPEMKNFPQEQINLFRKWMNQWTAFVQQQIEPPVSIRKKDIRQEILLDNVMPVPPENNYVKVREYILERCKYDKEFEKYFKAHKRTDFCDQLTLLFGWYVDPNALGKRMKSKAKK